MKTLYLALCLLIWLSCQPFPKDPAHTLEQVQNRILKAGVVLYDSTLVSSLSTQQKERLLVEGFAKSLGAQVQWVPGTQSQLAKLLHHRKIHLAVGAYTSPSPFEKEVSFTRPYFTERIVISGSNATSDPEDIKNQQVLVPTQLIGHYVEEHGGIPVMQDSLRPTAKLAAASEQLLKDIKLKPAAVLHEEKYVIAVPKGENAFLFKLEAFIDHYSHEE